MAASFFSFFIYAGLFSSLLSELDESSGVGIRGVFDSGNWDPPSKDFSTDRWGDPFDLLLLVFGQYSEPLTALSKDFLCNDSFWCADDVRFY